VDLGSALLEIGIGVGGGLVGAGIAAFKFGREMETVRRDALEAKNDAIEAKIRVDTLEKELKEDAKESEKSWRDLNYLLGQIASTMGIEQTRPDLPPMRARLPSRPR
jgi:hypothetical protein